MILEQNVVGYCLIPATAADVQHGNKHGHRLPGGIVLAPLLIIYFSC